MRRSLLIACLVLVSVTVADAQTVMQWAGGDPVIGPSYRTTSTPVLGSGVTAFFTSDLAPTRSFSGSGRFYTTWNNTNLAADKVGGKICYANSLTSPSQGVLAYLDRPGGNAHLDIITAYNASTGATTRTALINTAFTYVSGAQLLCVVDMGNPAAPFAQLFYGNAAVGGKIDLSAYASWLTVNRRHAIFSTTAVTPGSVVYDFGQMVLGRDIPRSFAITAGTPIIAGDTVTWANENASVQAAGYWTVNTLYQTVMSVNSYAGSGSILLPYDGTTGNLSVATTGLHRSYYIPKATTSMNMYSYAGHTAETTVTSVRRVQ